MGHLSKRMATVSRAVQLVSNLVCRDYRACVGRNERVEFGVGIETFSRNHCAVGVRAIQIDQSRERTAGKGPEQIGSDRNTVERPYLRGERVSEGEDQRLMRRLAAFHRDEEHRLMMETMAFGERLVAGAYVLEQLYRRSIVIVCLELKQPFEHEHRIVLKSCLVTECSQDAFEPALRWCFPRQARQIGKNLRPVGGGWERFSDLHAQGFLIEKQIRERQLDAA